MSEFYKRTRPSTQIVSTADMKTYMDVDTADHDDDIAEMILGVQDDLEEYLWLTFIDSTIELYLEDFPDSNVIKIRRGPVSAVSAIQYYDSANTLQPLDEDDYIVMKDLEPAQIKILSVPSIYDRADAIKITYTAGFGATVASVPAVFKKALKRMVNYLYDNPMDEDMRWPRAVEKMLYKHRKYQF